MSKLLQPFFQSTAGKSGQTLKLGVGWAGAWGDEGDEGDEGDGGDGEAGGAGEAGAEKIRFRSYSSYLGWERRFFTIPCSLFPVP
ncbi:MAG: hypothetical protein RIB93_26830 [Coleofasciculus sp. D1-CHI-01]|uniref:hypothetical protein n=1 Tax=Coleofasciculus sp. D1-CHI-01 TaxID=3068482 RepID=UPI0032F5BA57